MLIYKKIVAGYLVFVLLTISCTSSRRFGAHGGGESSGGQRTTAAVASSRNGKPLLTLKGVASYYSDQFHGKRTSNGEMFDMNDFTAAHRTFPFQTRVKVTNLDNDLYVIVRINDRGPFVDGRLIDLSLAAAKKLDLIKTGTAPVRLDVIEWGTGE